MVYQSFHKQIHILNTYLVTLSQLIIKYNKYNPTLDPFSLLNLSVATQDSKRKKNVFSYLLLKNINFSLNVNIWCRWTEVLRFLKNKIGSFDLSPASASHTTH